MNAHVFRKGEWIPARSETDVGGEAHMNVFFEIVRSYHIKNCLAQDVIRERQG
jgi:hypothetical protein